MAYVTIDDQHLHDIADTIRSKNGKTKGYKPREMANAIMNCPSASVGIALLTRTIEGHYYNGEVPYVRSEAFYDCDSLTSINLPNVTDIGESGIYHCANLRRVDLASARHIGPYSFTWCPKLEAVILRSGVMCDIHDFVNTENSLGYTTLCDSWNTEGDRELGYMNNDAEVLGFIYVPHALLEEYNLEYNGLLEEGERPQVYFRAIEEWPDICYYSDLKEAT